MESYRLDSIVIVFDENLYTHVSKLKEKLSEETKNITLKPTIIEGEDYAELCDTNRVNYTADELVIVLADKQSELNVHLKFYEHKNASIGDGEDYPLSITVVSEKFDSYKLLEDNVFLDFVIAGIEKFISKER